MQTFISPKDNPFSLTRQRRSAGAPNDWRRAVRLRSQGFDLSVLDTKTFGGAERDRTADPLLAKQVLSQLSYSPIQVSIPDRGPLINGMVGPGRLELPTSRLSSVCSNQLSYGPIREPVQIKLNKRGFLSS